MYLNTKCHFHYDQTTDKLQILYFEEDYIQFKNIFVTRENLSVEAKQKFKYLKTMFIYFNSHPQCVKINKNGQAKIIMQTSVGQKNNTNMQIDIISSKPSTKKPSLHQQKTKPFTQQKNQTKQKLSLQPTQQKQQSTKQKQDKFQLPKKQIEVQKSKQQQKIEIRKKPDIKLQLLSKQKKITYLYQKSKDYKELSTSSKQVSNLSNLDLSLRKQSFVDDKINQSKIKKLSQQLAQKNIENINLKKKIMELETQLRFKQAQITSLKNSLATKEAKNQSQRKSNQTKNSQLMQHQKQSNLLNSQLQEQTQHKTQKQTIYLSVYSPIQNRSSNRTSVNSSDRQISSNHQEMLINIISDTKSTNDKQEYELKRSGEFSNKFIGGKPPTKMHLLVDKVKIQSFFSIIDSKGTNKIIQKINGANVGHQVVFDNAISKDGSSFYRLANKGIKNNFLFVGVTLESKKNQKTSFFSKQSVSYNCANGCIWSGSQSHKNSQLGKQLKTGQIMTVLVNCQSRTISWFIGKRITGFYSIEHLFCEEYKDLKLYPFIGMQGVNDKVEVLNEEDVHDFSIQTLMNEELYKRAVEKRGGLLSTQFIEDTKVKIRTKSVNIENR